MAEPDSNSDVAARGKPLGVAGSFAANTAMRAVESQIHALILCRASWAQPRGHLDICTPNPTRLRQLFILFITILGFVFELQL